MNLPEKLVEKLEQRKRNNALRQLGSDVKGIDFSSNDYLGFAHSEELYQATHQFLVENNFLLNGATGSRLISGNHQLYSITEQYIAQFHQSEEALIFNSGYDANVGFFSAVPQRNDIVLYDELCHASIRDGIQMGLAKSYKFQHNNYEDLENLLQKFNQNTTIYVVTESVYSMDGDSPILDELVSLKNKYNCLLVIDEAHALGVFGDKGEGLVQAQNLQNHFFARIITFGKGLGCHGAAIIGSSNLKLFLVNFCRSLIYTTGLTPHSVATIYQAYKKLENSNEIYKLKDNIQYFNQLKKLSGIQNAFIYSKSAIHSVIVPGNENVKSMANQMINQGFSVKAILSPTVPEGQERLRFCLHSFTSKEAIEQVVNLVVKILFQ